MSNLLPQDGYDTFITAAIGAADDEIFVNELPTQTSGFLTIYDTDGRTVLEKIKYGSLQSDPPALEDCIRGLALVPAAGAYSDSGDATLAVSHPANVRIAMTDNVHYLGRALSQLNGDETLGGVPKNPAVRTLSDPRHLVDLEALNAIAAGTLGQFLVTQNGSSPSLSVNVAAGIWIKSDKTINTFAGASAQAVSANQTNYIEFNPSGGTISINTSAFTTGRLPLAIAVTNGTTVTSLTDKRGFFTLTDGLVDVVRTWTTIQTLTAALLQITTDPSASNDAMRYSKAQAMVSNNEATGLSGEAFSIGADLYVKASDGKVYKAAATADESTYSFVGIALDAAGGAGVTVRYAKPGGIATGLSGLTAGSYYFISDTAGTIAVTPGTRFAKIGQALTTTTLRVCEPKFVRSGTVTISGVASTTITTGFYPAFIRIRAGLAGAVSKISGISLGGSDNNCVFTREDAATGNAGYINKAWQINNADGNRNIGTIDTLTQTGFNLNCSTSAIDAQIQWEAESL